VAMAEYPEEDYPFSLHSAGIILEILAFSLTEDVRMFSTRCPSECGFCSRGVRAGFADQPESLNSAVWQLSL